MKRPIIFTKDTLLKIKQLRNEGYSVKEISKIIGIINHHSIYTMLNRNGMKLTKRECLTYGDIWDLFWKWKKSKTTLIVFCTRHKLNYNYISRKFKFYSTRWTNE